MQIEPSSNISNTKYSGYGEYTLSVNEFNRLATIDADIVRHLITKVGE